LDWPQLTELAKATFDQNNVNVADIVRGAVDADLLVLDEIGAGKLTEWEFKTLLFPLLNGRTGKKTIVTTNLTLKELENWFMWGRPDGQGKDTYTPIDDKGRLFDRVLGNFQLVKNSGSSKRREDALARRQA
jgi:DNA replication protein DnaC